VQRHTDVVRYCVQLGFIKAAVLSICKNVITQRPRELGCGGGGDDEIQEIHSECLNTEKETPLSRTAQNSGEKKTRICLANFRSCSVSKHPYETMFNMNAVRFASQLCTVHSSLALSKR
jgi:hypothetical protein